MHSRLKQIFLTAHITYYSGRVSNVSCLQLSLCGDHPENKKVDMLGKINFIFTLYGEILFWDITRHISI